jgi:hypothetical protein
VIEDVSDTSAMAHYHNPNRLPDSPLVQNFPDLKSNLVYAKQIISTATNTSLLDIPKREKAISTLSPHTGLASSYSGIHTSTGAQMLSPLGYSGKALGPNAQAKPLANSATKADMNWLYNVNKGTRKFVFCVCFGLFCLYVYVWFCLFCILYFCTTFALFV